MKAVTRRALLQSAGASGLACALPALSQTQTQAQYPDHPIRLLVPFPAGALTDLLGRMVAERLRPVLGQPLVVENRPGAGTLIGASVVAKSPADGYSLLVATSTTLAISPAMYTSPPATAADLTGVAMIGTVSLFLVTRNDLKVNDLKALVAQMRARPGQLNYASPGTGTMHHLIVEMLKAEEKVSATHVPYQGSIAALTDLVSGRVDFMFLDAVAALPQIQAGKINALAVAVDKRLASMPQLPTVMESYPQLDLQAWQSIAAPKGTPAAIINRLNAEINKSLDSPEGRAALLRVGVEANPLSVQALNELIARDGVRLGNLVRSINLKAS
ncbi:MAG: tripartite tricarboxylate transporter substrate binding protein [Burkholderiaceae bacterium]|nr:tripartite tricarboxylate transporter substrate binding protein [Burkholderiaceae bacterium]